MRYLQTDTVRRVFYSSISFSSFSFNTDNQNSKYCFWRNLCCRSTAFGEYIENEQGVTISLSNHHVLIMFIQHRHSQVYIFAETESVLKGQNIWPMHWKWTGYENVSIHWLNVYYFRAIQTLTTLNLAANEIGDEGMRHLANALQMNNVRQMFFFHQSHVYQSYLTQRLTTLYLARNQIGNTGARYLADILQTNAVRQFLYWSMYCSVFSFNADTHNALSCMERNWHCRSKTSSQCIANEHREIIFALFDYLFTIFIQYRHSQH